ncbi:hypothetical protein BKA82DRAFT_4486738 [Pisolithus tinctorius]|nr:hypothetical protein BKA82DRAFT_4486738 [Pisolithus tinctorius]
MTEEFAHPKFWAAGVGRNQYKWSCLACKDDKWRDVRSARRHEKTTLHQENVGHLLSPHLCPSSSPPRPDPTSPLLNLLADFSESGSPPHGVSRAATPSNNDGSIQLDWDAIDHEQLYLPSAHDEQLTTMASSLAAWLADGDDAISSDEDVSNSPDVEGEEYCPEPLQPGATRSSQRAGDAAPANPAWFPWPDKQTCILDILRHLPRSLFSDAQLQVILWGLAILGVDNVPSTKTLKDIDNSLQSQYGIPSVRYQGALGHIYYVNHLPSIIAQEMANPRVRPHIRHYPEDAGGRLDQPWQATRWLYEIDPTVATPMIRKGRQDFYVFELAKLMDGTMVVPQRWYTKPSALLTSPPFELEYWARAWRAHPVVSGHTRGYVIHTYDTIEVPASSLLLSFPHLLQTHQVDGQPDPCNIIGLIEMRGHGVLPWTLTDPVVGNIWRARAKGHRVLSYMIWLYCDDTSGNMSKKWNKHNSFLFTAAGLPRALVHKESNIHFLATSNIAPPLEMLDGIVAQLEHAQMHGIWAWDIEAREMVLVIPAVLAMLGDNPMQSELACHVGLQGKFFCRNCWVQGVGAESSEHPQVPQPDDDTCSIETASHMTDSDRSTHGGVTQRLKGKGRRSETMQGLVDRARRFLGANTPRTRQHTVEKLRSMFHEVTSGMGKTRYAKMKTDTGIKDTYMDVFVERILKRVKGIRAGTDRFTEAVNAITQGRSVEEFMSPVWRIKGLDPHQDTPVEVLHVILLGFVKYFWRDAISRMNDDQKAELQVRLASFDTSGLGIPPLAAQTFVQYAGSLTGRDFRAICQAAPFVLYDLVPRECYEAFLALSSLVPLVWQPCIDNIDRHLADLRAAIDHFLNCTARWTPRWFNKPKFHILRHLPDHIQRFGPAILFATEGFESYNAIIRDHSIHSNRQAPSRDIARGMARCNRVRHLLSSGKFHARELTELPYSNNEHEWLVPGSGVKSLTSLDIPTFRNVIADYFGLTDDRDPLEAGSCVHDKTRPRPLEKTITALRVPYALPRVKRRLYQACRSIVATNGETCRLGDFVLAREPRAAGHELPLIGSLHEILQICHSPAQQRNQANWLLLETFKVTGSADIYHLPRIQPLGWVVLPATAVICCVNVQHNCAGHGCTGSSTVSVYEEREKTTKTAKRIEHREPLDLILNTAQMRNACHVQRFRTPVQQLDRDWAIHTGAAAEFNAQKIKMLKTSRANATKQPPRSTSQAVPTRFINVFHQTDSS